MERSCETTDCPDSADARSPDDKTEIPDLYAFLPASRAPTSARLGPVVDTAGQQRLLGALANALVRGQRRAVRGVACLPSRPWGWRSRRGLGVMLAGMAAALSRDLCKISLSDTRWGGGRVTRRLGGVKVTDTGLLQRMDFKSQSHQLPYIQQNGSLEGQGNFSKFKELVNEGPGSQKPLVG